ncbi:pentapeptide repeat-containing protein [Tolypothrix sp. NIES-4075]|uniref:pentapeptide repeat-containing protein n=1 Tax=Tolypothrix sp. NIES-4075 TaxID=2005459 RepID=UPI000B5CC16D|nr:pentapeptide repeat-containing protein [Tolypothrix sp. NIES-4075]
MRNILNYDQELLRSKFRGRFFKGQNLERANFSGADIRNAHFIKAILRAVK